MSISLVHTEYKQYFIGESAVSISTIPDDVQKYAQIMKKQYRQQPIVAIDWPPRVGKYFFGRLALVEKQESTGQSESAWYLLRGQVDRIAEVTGNKHIHIEDVLQPTDGSVRVVIDGPPGIGKTTLCHKLLNMWSNGTLVHKQYDLVLYCPLRNKTIAAATTLADLFEYKSSKVSKVVDWMLDREGEGFLIIFDGWDELNAQLRELSLVSQIIHGKQLDQCSVIVSSRSYASASLLEMSFLSRHVQVIGFSEKEIPSVIIQRLQKDTKLAQELIDKKREDDENYRIFETTQDNKDSQLAVKLINDLEVRGDVRSLCYVPLVCSMVILVYCKEGGRLPTTLTQLYENFVLQTIRRQVKRQSIDPHTLGSLSSLPLQLAKPFQEICQLAYFNLSNTRMTFSLHELHEQSLSEAVKEDYLGLMTTFTEYDEVKYQFLHLSIQEFLAAWWIAKFETRTEEVFKHHFYDDHFRMCLRFVAGLTHLDHENYEQYFNEKLDVQCKREPSFDFNLSLFYENPEIKQNALNVSNFHIKTNNFDSVPILLLQLLYESQNTKLCQVFAQSMNNHLLCLDRDRVSLSLFDWLCVSYFIENSNITWNHLHLGTLNHQTLSAFLAGLTNIPRQAHCKRMEIRLDGPTDELTQTLLQPSLLRNIREFYVVLALGSYVPCHVLLNFLSLPHLKILHLVMHRPTVLAVDIEKCSELEKYICMNSTLTEMTIKYEGKEITNTIVGVLKGVARNRTLTSFSLHIIHLMIITPPPPLPIGVIEQLLKDNNTLKALSLDIPDNLLPISLNIVEMNVPLIALEIGGWSCILMKSLVSHIKKLSLHCLILPIHEPYPPCLILTSHSSLHTLVLPLDTAKSAIELFTILQTNTTLEALKLKIKEVTVYTSSMGSSLQDMLSQNQMLKYLQFNNEQYNTPIPNSFLSYLTNGLRHNNFLQQLNVSISLNELINPFFNVISQRQNLTDLVVHFVLSQQYNNYSYEDKNQIKTPLFYEQVLPAVTKMLQSHKTMSLLWIRCEYLNESSQPNWIEIVYKLYESIFIHPSLVYIRIDTGYPIPPLLKDALADQKLMLIDMHKNKQPHKPLPVVSINY